MNLYSLRTRVVILVVITVGILSALLIPIITEWKRYRDADALWSVMVILKNQPYTEAGFWTGDIAGLYKLGLISKEVAEADAAPINALTDHPKAFREYYFVAMESGPPDSEGQEPVLLKQKTRHKEVFAYCVFPAAASQNLPTYILTRVGIFRKQTTNNQAITRWPGTSGKPGDGWAIVD
jgi:hypothetical protein